MTAGSPLPESLIRAARRMNDSGLNTGASGNLSVRCEGGMLITPSGVPYGDLEPEQLVFVDQAGADPLVRHAGPVDVEVPQRARNDRQPGDPGPLPFQPVAGRRFSAWQG